MLEEVCNLGFLGKLFKLNISSLGPKWKLCYTSSILTYEAKAEDVKWAKIKIELSSRVLNDSFCHDMQIILGNQILI